MSTNLPARSYGAIDESVREVALALFLELRPTLTSMTATCAAVAGHFDLSPSTVRNWVRASGADTPSEDTDSAQRVAQLEAELAAAKTANRHLSTLLRRAVPWT